MSKAKWCKGEELNTNQAFRIVLTKPIIYMNGRAMSTRLFFNWYISNFYKHTWHRAIPLVHEKELIEKVLSYTSLKSRIELNERLVRQC